ncbi:ubiquinol-cytochrome c reductase cytochrome c1 [Acetobacter nitrogenifigens DSM 23921 = NBRC 105050]|uniref:Cytochrome c1 n=1 Tax=Acetobacter nitrogenifigens DSM 23921 = NBRC 105050 TaxID=1120919 RepID=A0A511XEF2_9PROT|nr:cytochrome c1 [Acetobacter nitrogenifigens]GBQ92398.1 ubiquinol-cytochrome c reductase cytochrome c1 [Acetobacter nitrogenifigens DSM 23921 = NBRC 105050]GEN61329.1 cytochrome c [Acetobacter nitrogenifigens DSM 23921 = NBRC 105050]
MNRPSFLRGVASAAIVAALLSPASSFAAKGDHDPAPKRAWSFDGPLGHFDLASVQRGYAVYAQVCSNCHGMEHVYFGDLRGMGLNDHQAEAVAESHTVPDGVEGKTRPATLDDAFPTPPVARGLTPGAVIPPDQSRLAVVYPGGPDRIYALLTGYGPPPAGVTEAKDTFYNRFALGRTIAMPPPLHDGSVVYADGTQATLDQEAQDVTTFLAWVAQPHLDERRRVGVRVTLYLLFLGCLLFILKRRVWSNVH